MVGGHRSLGCARCRQRKVRCNLARPKCDHCTRRGEECGGWPEALAFSHVRRDSLLRTRRPSPPMPLEGAQALAMPGGAAWDEGIFGLRNATMPLPMSMSLSSAPMMPSMDLAAQETTTTATHMDDTAPTMLEPALSSAFRHYLQEEFCNLYLPRASSSLHSEALARQQHGQPPETPTSVSEMKQTYIDLALDLVASRKSPMFEKAFVAEQLVFLGREQRDMELINQATTLYQEVLSSLQHVISQLDEANMADHWLPVILTICCCSWIELLGTPLSESSPSAVMNNNIRHTVGAGWILRQLGLERGRHLPYFFQSISSFRLQAFFSFIVKREVPSFIATEAWLYRSWCHHIDRKPNALQLLIDEAIQIPVILQHFDAATAPSPVASSVDSVAMVESLLGRAGEVGLAIDAWSREHAAPGDWTSSQWSQPDEVYFAFFDIHAGHASLFCSAVRICLMNLEAGLQGWLTATAPEDLATASTWRTKLALSDDIFRSVEYFFEARHGNTAKSQALPLFRIAKQTLAEAMGHAEHDTHANRQRLEWCRRVDQRYAARGYPCWPEN